MIEAGDLLLLPEDTVEGFLHCRGDPFLPAQNRHDIAAEIGQYILRVLGMKFVDRKRLGLSRVDFQPETMKRGRRLLRFLSLRSELPVRFGGMLDHDFASGIVRVMDGVFCAPALFASQNHQALRDFYVGVWLLVRFCLRLHLHGCVGRVGKQAPFVRMHGGEDALAGEGAAVDDVEGAGVERLAAGVLEPERAQRSRLFIPHRNFVRFDGSVENRHES